MANWLFMSLVPYAIFVPILVYGNIKLFQNKNRAFIQKRSLFMTFGLNISLIYMIIVSGIAQTTELFCSNDAAKCKYTGSVFIITGLWTLLYFLNTNNFLIFFRYKWTYYTLELEWKQLINPNIATNTEKNKNWFIKNHHKYGNNRYVFKLFAFVHGIGFTVHCLSVLILTDAKYAVWAAVLSLISLLPAFIFYPVIVSITPSWNDIFYIHWESKIHAKLLLSVLAWLVIGAALILIKFKHGIAVVGVLMSLTYFTMCYISTFIVSKKNTEDSKQELIENIQNHSLQNILCHEECVHLFIGHLSKEFSMECLLSLIEIQQYQQYIVNNSESNENVRNVTGDIKLFEFPENMPFSLIVEQTKNMNQSNDSLLLRYKQCAHQLFNKYIKTGSEFELNISYSDRQRLYSILNDFHQLKEANVNEVDLLLLFEQTKKNMREYLGYSLTRFKARNEYNQIQQALAKSNKNNKTSFNIIVN